jgi:hypothetical protein
MSAQAGSQFTIQELKIIPFKQENKKNVKFQFRTEVSMKIVFLNIALCSLMEVDIRSEVLTASSIRVMNALRMEAVSTPEISVNFYETT